MTKMTYAIAIDNAINGIMDEATREKLEALKASLAKRNSGERKPTKGQIENEALKARILELLGGEGRQCKDIATEMEISGQKCSALLKQLVDTNQIEKYTEKRVTYFKGIEG